MMKIGAGGNLAQTLYKTFGGPRTNREALKKVAPEKLLGIIERRHARNQALGENPVIERCFARLRQQDVIDMVANNLGLVNLIASHYVNRGLEFQELVSEGVLGLFRAAERLDLKRGVAFSTYAAWWIKGAIKRAILENRNLMSGSRTLRLWVARLNRAENSYEKKFGVKPTEEELASLLGISIKNVRKFKLAAAVKISFLQKEIAAGERAFSLLDVIPDETVVSPDDQITDRKISARLMQEVNKLPPAQKKIINELFGLDGKTPKFEREIANEMRISRARVGQIKLAALLSLRKKLIPFLGFE